MVKKLNRIKIEEMLKAEGFELFSRQEFQGLFGVSANTASVYISKNVRSGLFVKLRNGFYLVKDSVPDRPFIAGKLYQPSYVSLETALSHYGIIPEVVYATTSITTKATREFATPVGTFIYQQIKVPAFTGYQLRVVDRHKTFIADPEKALADYLYFVDLKKVSLNDRMRLKGLNKVKLITYAKLFQRPSLLQLIRHVYVESRKPTRIY
jgi:predicted transcriptional regulator of viral defense system